MARSPLKQLYVISALAILGLFVLACSSQVPVSSPAGSTQVNSLAPALVNGVEPEEPAQQPPSTDVIPESQEMVPQPQPINVIPEPREAADTSSPPPELSANLTELGGTSGTHGEKVLEDSVGAMGIVASGSGSASSAPDLATLRLGVEAIAGTVSEARTTAATAMTAIIGSVNEDGVEEKDVQTGYFSIQPRYTGREVTRCIDSESAAEEKTANGATEDAPDLEGTAMLSEPQECFQEYQSVITGYQVSNNVTVLVRELDTIDDVIDGAVAAGGDNIRFNGLSFSLEDTTELESQARAAAVADLKAKAAELASLTEVELGDLIYLTEGGAAPPPVVRAEFALARAAFDSAGSVSTPIAPGEVSIQVSVVGHYLISQPE